MFGNTNKELEKAFEQPTDSNPLELVVMWCMMPLKILIFIMALFLMPFYTLVDYGTSPCDEKRYTQFVIRNFKGLVRFLTT